jgi:ATPase subunit of ABC transporter with duplicated ATPase domains
MTNSIVAEGLTKRFGPVTAVGGISLAVKEGTVFGLLGPNGAGKTTTVHILPTLVRPDGGLQQTGSLAWRTLVQIKHNPLELMDFSVQPAASWSAARSRPRRSSRCSTRPRSPRCSRRWRCWRSGAGCEHRVQRGQGRPPAALDGAVPLG